LKLQLRFFASLREALACDHDVVEVPASVTTVGELRVWLCGRGGVWAETLAEGRPVRAALDQAMVGAQAALHEGAEVAFFPPVTGG
jgi:molybdopterin synthase sulfur carrier subunit